MYSKHDLDLEGLTVESTEISFDPSVPMYNDLAGQQAARLYYTNTQPVPEPDTNSSPCIA